MASKKRCIVETVRNNQREPQARAELIDPINLVFRFYTGKFGRLFFLFWHHQIDHIPKADHQVDQDYDEYDFGRKGQVFSVYS